MKKISLFLAMIFLLCGPLFAYEDAKEFLVDKLHLDVIADLPFWHSFSFTGSIKYAYPRKGYGTAGIIIGHEEDWKIKGLLLEGTFGHNDSGASIGIARRDIWNVNGSLKATWLKAKENYLSHRLDRHEEALGVESDFGGFILHFNAGIFRNLKMKSWFTVFGIGFRF